MVEQGKSLLIQEVASKPRTLTHNQTRRLESLDIEVNRHIVAMDADIKYRIQHKAWEHRQFNPEK